MTFSSRTRSAWYLIWAALASLVVVSVLVVLRTEGTLLRWIIRDMALLGYISIFLAIVSSYYKKEVMKIFGRPFLSAHHILSLTGFLLLTLHPVGVAWDEMNAAVFVPVFFPIYDMLRLGGRIAWYIFVLGVLTALWRRQVGKSWRTIHIFNYLAFAFGTIHANLLGANFEDILVRVVSIAMFILATVLFFRQRIDA